MYWVGRAKEDLKTFPRPVVREIDRALTFAQLGGKHPSAKPLKGFGGASKPSTTTPRAECWRAIVAHAMTKVQKGSSNVFDDLGFDDAEDLQAEAVLADQIYVILKELGISQRAAAELLGIDQSDVSRLMKGRYTGFSLRRLMTLLNRLDRDVELVVKRHRGRGKAGLTVRAR